MALRDKKFIRTRISKTNQSFVSIGSGTFSFNSKFSKEADLLKYTKVTVYVDEINYKIGFEFHNNEDERNSFTLQFRGAKMGGVVIKAQEIIFNTSFIKKITNFTNSSDKRFPVFFDRTEKLWTINISPTFEIKILNKDEVPGNIRGIYRYLDKKEVVYIGRGKIKSRLNSPERKDWKFDVVEYSILDDEEKQIEWETYWIKRHREDHGGELPHYNKVEGWRNKKTIEEN